MSNRNSFGAETTLRINGQPVRIYSLAALDKAFPGVSRLPYSMKILLENLLRTEDGTHVTARSNGAVRSSWK